MKVHFLYLQIHTFVARKSGSAYEEVSAGVAPNPASTSIRLLFTAPVSGSVGVSDMMGQPLLFEKIILLNSWETDISKLSSGIYLVTVIDQNNVKSTQRLVVIK